MLLPSFVQLLTRSSRCEIGCVHDEHVFSYPHPTPSAFLTLVYCVRYVVSLSLFASLLFVYVYALFADRVARSHAVGMSSYWYT